jgi:hypothetical protein
MGGRQIVLVSTAGFSVLNTVIFWREDKTKRLFSQCICLAYSFQHLYYISRLSFPLILPLSLASGSFCPPSFIACSSPVSRLLFLYVFTYHLLFRSCLPSSSLIPPLSLIPRLLSFLSLPTISCYSPVSLSRLMFLSCLLSLVPRLLFFSVFTIHPICFPSPISCLSPLVLLCLYLPSLVPLLSHVSRLLFLSCLPSLTSGSSHVSCPRSSYLILPF